MCGIVPILICGILACGPPAGDTHIGRDKVIVFFPTYGHRVDGGACWELSIHGWIFEPERRGAVAAYLLSRLELDTEKMDEQEKAAFAARAAAFLVDNERGERITIRIDDQEFALDASAPNGHFFGRVRLPAGPPTSAQGIPASAPLTTAPAKALKPFTVVLPPGDARVFRGQVELIEDTGFSVISDIDDTIKVSEVADKKKLLRNTFLRPYVAVAGMAEVYSAWAGQSGASFHYVSASPWQLYVPLAQFLETAGFPRGTFHLKLFRWKDESFFNLFASPETQKLAVIEEILATFPHRQFVLAGDSGEKDPETYGELARRHPQQIVRILIRDLGPADANAARFRAAFEGMPPQRWQTFREPSELPRRIP